MIDILLAAAIAIAGPSDPNDETPYVLVAWEVPGGPNNIWEPDQVIAKTLDLAEPSLHALDNALPCGTYYQIDLEWDSQITRDLIAGGVLRNPNDPAEDHAYGAVEGNPWTYLQTAPCAEQPEPRPFVYDNVTHNCDVTTTVHQEGTYLLTFDSIANVWIEDAVPTLTVDVSSSVPVAYEDRPAGCEPVLAATGPNDGWLLFGIVLSVSMILAGLWLSRKRK